jgi:hypothetical protein
LTVWFPPLEAASGSKLMAPEATSAEASIEFSSGRAPPL